MQVGQEDFGEPQPCFGLGLQAEKDSGVHNLFGCKDAAVPPRVQHRSPPLPRPRPPGPVAAPGRAAAPTRHLSHPGVTSPTKSGGACAGEERSFSSDARDPGSSRSPTAPTFWPCLQPPGGQPASR